MEERGINKIAVLIAIGIFLLTIPLVQSEGLKGTLITGDVVSVSISDIYEESSPSIVKILEYSGCDLYLPDYKYNEFLDKFVPISGGKNIIGEKGYGFEYLPKSFPYSPRAYGSGFVISENGYILTNAHVIGDIQGWKQNTKAEIAYYDFQVLEEEYYRGNMDIETYNDFLYLNNYLYEYLEISPRIDYKVVVGVDGVGTGSKIYTPRLIDTEGGTYEDVMDWSLIKIEETGLDYLKIGDSDKISEGSEVIVMGYTGISEEDYSKTLVFKNDVKPTITKGLVSHVKDEGLYRTLQIDASASGGNSGGPVMDTNGNVIGILTSGVNEYPGGIYNYAQRINDILPRISNYVTLQKVEESEDEGGFFDSWGGILVVLLIILIIGVMVLLVVLFKRNKTSKKGTKRNRL